MVASNLKANNMQTHPFFGSVIDRIAGILAAIVAWIIYSLLLYCYGDLEWWIAGIDGFVSIGLLAIAGYLYGYVFEAIHSRQMYLLLSSLVQIICLAGAWETESWLQQEAIWDFSVTIPLRLTLGVSAWIILSMWYHIYNLEEQSLEESIEPDEPEYSINEISLAKPDEEIMLDRISVKDGSRIHIIHLDELLYLQACGDYVTLFTSTGQYIKEQTMKYFEMHLPAEIFVRIHRSCIVNMEQILRIELFGKENYQVRLKNDVCLRASLSGYKLLKERLSL